MFEAINKYSHRFKRVPKRLRYVISSVAGAILLFVGVGVPYQQAWLMLIFLIMAGYALTWFALLEDIKGIEWGILFILPVVWTACWYLTFYMVPMRLLTRLIFSLLYPTILYVIVSAMNIFNVSVGRSIQLHRAAQAANYFVIVLVYYLVTRVVLSFSMPNLLTGIVLGIFTFILSLQHYWTIVPSVSLSANSIRLSAFQAFAMSYLMVLMSLLPFANESPRPIIITGVYYVLSSLFASLNDEVLLYRRLRELILVIIILALTVLFTLRW